MYVFQTTTGWTIKLKFSHNSLLFSLNLEEVQDFMSIRKKLHSKRNTSGNHSCELKQYWFFLCRRFLLKYVTQNRFECVTHHRNTEVKVQNKQIINFLFNDVNDAEKWRLRDNLVSHKQLNHLVGFFSLLLKYFIFVKIFAQFIFQQ